MSATAANMSLFKRPKKPMQPRMFSSYDDDIDADARMDVDVDEPPPALTISNAQHRPIKEKPKQPQSVEKQKKPSLLSFDHEGNSFTYTTPDAVPQKKTHIFCMQQTKATRCSRSASRRTARKL